MNNDIVRVRAAPGELPCYELSDTEMGLGTSLGNGHAWINTGADGRILSLFATDVGRKVAGPLIMRYASCGTGGDSEQPNIPLAVDGPGHFEVHPTFQCHHFRLTGGLCVSETVFLPLGEPGSIEDACAVYRVIELTNHSERFHEVRAFAIANLSGLRRQMEIAAEYDESVWGLVATRQGQADDGYRALSATVEPLGHTLTTDLASMYDPERLPKLDGPGQGSGELVASLAVGTSLEPGERTRFAFLLTYAPGERDRVVALTRKMQDFEPIFERSKAYHRQRLASCQVLTPDPVVNQGALWAKVNMLRVLAHYPQGQSFTNEPGVSSNVVTRDVAWFVYGCDHFLPDVSRDMLNALVRSQADSGKVPEYYNAVTGETEDYDLNISDPTPLFILAINHHVRSTGDRDYLQQVYDSVKRAADYILSQRDDRGLVYCTATGFKEHGIASWRNVIPNYQISGAVTEINAECAAALRAVSHLAENIDRPQQEIEHFRNGARAVTEAMQEHLLNRERQLYLLNIGPDGQRHTDVTADEVFPVLFRVADDMTAYRIIRRLTNTDFWTSAGLRTASRMDLRYDPSRDVGLVGGVWPGMTWWFAFAAARYYPAMMVQALRASYEHYSRHPRVYNTVPGQFSEWFDGESLTNRGMRLSPWEPPRFLWAAIEGVVGLMIGPGKACLNPLRPADWHWAAVRRIWYHGEQGSFFTMRHKGCTRAYTTLPLKSDCVDEQQLFDQDVTDAVRVGHSDLHAVALRDAERIVVVIGSSRNEAITTLLDFGDLLEPEVRYELGQFSSEAGWWIEPVEERGKHLCVLGVRVEAGGYHLLDLRRAD